MKRALSESTLVGMSRADLERGEEIDLAAHVPRPGRVVVRRARAALSPLPWALPPIWPGTRRLRRLAEWLSVLLGDEGMSARFAAERRCDDDLVRRVERRRRS